MTWWSFEMYETFIMSKLHKGIENMITRMIQQTGFCVLQEFPPNKHGLLNLLLDMRMNNLPLLLE
jgi:hypothetical protein